jgi:serine/threonine protein kinase
MWSFGVILFELLCGYPPFWASNDRNLYEKICNCRYGFSPDHFRKVSKSARDLISRLLVRDPKHRLSSDQALKHPWICASGVDLARRNLEDSLVQLRKYQNAKKFKAAVRAIAATTKLKLLVSKSNGKKLALNKFGKFQDTYRLGDEICSSTIYKILNAVEKSIEEDVEVKMMDLSSAAEPMRPQLVLEIKREAEILKSINSPLIIGYKDYFEEDTVIYLVTEKLFGGDLTDRITRREVYTEWEARNFAKKLLEAIKVLHDNEIVHR